MTDLFSEAHHACTEGEAALTAASAPDSLPSADNRWTALEAAEAAYVDCLFPIGTRVPSAPTSAAAATAMLDCPGCAMADAGPETRGVTSNVDVDACTVNEDEYPRVGAGDKTGLAEVLWYGDEASSTKAADTACLARDVMGSFTADHAGTTHHTTAKPPMVTLLGAEAEESNNTSDTTNRMHPHDRRSARTHADPSLSTASTHYCSATPDFPPSIVTSAAAAMMAALAVADSTEDVDRVASSTHSAAPHRDALATTTSPATITTPVDVLPTSWHRFPSPLTINTSPEQALYVTRLALEACEEEAEVRQARTLHTSASASMTAAPEGAAERAPLETTPVPVMAHARTPDVQSHVSSPTCTLALPPTSPPSLGQLPPSVQATSLSRQELLLTGSDVTPLVTDLDVARLARARQLLAPPLPVFASPLTATRTRTTRPSFSGQPSEWRPTQSPALTSRESAFFAPLEAPTLDLPRILPSNSPDSPTVAVDAHVRLSPSPPPAADGPRHPTVGRVGMPSSLSARIARLLGYGAPTVVAVTPSPAEADRDAASTSRWWPFQPKRSPTTVFVTREGMCRSISGSSQTQAEQSAMDAGALPDYMWLGARGGSGSGSALAQTIAGFVHAWHTGRETPPPEPASTPPPAESEAAATPRTGNTPLTQQLSPMLPSFDPAAASMGPSDEEKDGQLPFHGSFHQMYRSTLGTAAAKAVSAVSKVVDAVSPVMTSISASPKDYGCLLSHQDAHASGTLSVTRRSGAQATTTSTAAEAAEAAEADWLVLDDAGGTAGGPPHLIEPPMTPCAPLRGPSRRRVDATVCTTSQPFTSAWHGSSGAMVETPLLERPGGLHGAGPSTRARVKFPSFAVHSSPTSTLTPCASSNSLCGMQRNAFTSVTAGSAIPAVTVPTTRGHTKTCFSDALLGGRLSERLYALFRRPPSIDLHGRELCETLFHTIEAHDAQRGTIDTAHTEARVIAVDSVMALLDPEEIVSHGHFFPRRTTCITLDEFTYFVEVVSVQFQNERAWC